MNKSLLLTIGFVALSVVGVYFVTGAMRNLRRLHATSRRVYRTALQIFLGMLLMVVGLGAFVAFNVPLPLLAFQALIIGIIIADGVAGFGLSAFPCWQR